MNSYPSLQGFHGLVHLEVVVLGMAEVCSSDVQKQQGLVEGSEFVVRLGLNLRQVITELS